MIHHLTLPEIAALSTVALAMTIFAIIDIINDHKKDQ